MKGKVAKNSEIFCLSVGVKSNGIKVMKGAGHVGILLLG